MVAGAQAAASQGGRSRVERWHVTAFVVFAASAATTLYFWRTMAGSMRMPGGWEMSMAWMRVGSWAATTVMFCLMWLAMMVFMMLPSSAPVLMLVRRSLQFQGAAHPEALTWTVAAGYFLSWTGFGLVAYAAGVGCTEAAMAWTRFSRAVPWLTGVAVIGAGVYQLLPAKSACLRHCRDPLLLVAHLRPGWRGALRLGLHHGAFCVACCWALMVIQLVLGVMSLPLMLLVAAVIAWEKLAASSTLPARVAGVVAMAAGAWIVARALLAA